MEIKINMPKKRVIFMKIVSFFGLLLFISSGCCCCKKNIPAPTPSIPVSVVQKGHRQLAVDVSMPSDNDYNKAFEMAKGMGMERIGLFQNWDTIEPSPNNYSGQWLSIADTYYPPKKVSLDLTIAVIHTNHSTVPEDIKNKPLNDPEVIKRFKSLLDFVFSTMPNTSFASISISSESDIYLGTDEKKWDEFQAFYKEIVSYIHRKKAGIPVTTEFSFKGLTGKMKNNARAINKISDAIGVSHYPISDDFSVKDPAVIAGDFDAIISLYPDKPVLFYQLGYPSSKYIKSSEELQAQFVSETFRAWDKHRDKIKMIDFTWLHDMSPQKVDEMTRVYGISARGFTEFLASLGLRTYEGRDKPAFQRLKDEAKLRGW